MPQVTVCMAFHRVTPYLRPAVRSILDQTLDDLELILVDNGTGAGLAALGDEGRDPRLRLISHPTNEGVAGANNAARAQARGEFIALMDADDLALPLRLERQVAVLRSEPRLGLLTTHALAVDQTGEIIRSQFTLCSEREQRIFSAYSMPATNPTVLGRRAVFERFPFRSEFLVSSDYDFFSRVVEAYPCRALPEALLHYRLHEGQATTEQQPLMVLNACIIRLLTARRRAGRPENLEGLIRAWDPRKGEAPPARESYARFARLALIEGFPLLTVFFARRIVATRRSPRGFALAARLTLEALARAPTQRGMLLRMFATGPLRTHGLKPVPAGGVVRAGG